MRQRRFFKKSDELLGEHDGCPDCANRMIVPIRGLTRDGCRLVVQPFLTSSEN
jgi:hypothetical protein